MTPIEAAEILSEHNQPDTLGGIKAWHTATLVLGGNPEEAAKAMRYRLEGRYPVNTCTHCWGVVETPSHGSVRLDVVQTVPAGSFDSDAEDPDELVEVWQTGFPSTFGVKLFR